MGEDSVLKCGESLNYLPKAFEFWWRIIDRTVGWITDNEVWSSNVLPDSMVIVLFIALAAYSVIQLQHGL